MTATSREPQSAHAFEIRLLHRADEMGPLVTLFQQVWGTPTPVVGVEMLCAVAHSGGYVAGVFEHGRAIGASLAFLGRHAGEPTLHSHITGVLPGIQHSGVGRAIKQHQREWAAAQSIVWITWTFDPLVRRNAWFNIEVLGAQVSEYLENFYGPMTDALNANDESDRLLVAWPTVADSGTSSRLPSVEAGPGSALSVPTPDDIVALRRTDPAGAREWRHRVRRELGGALADGGAVVGFTRDGSYLVATSRGTTSHTEER